MSSPKVLVIGGRGFFGRLLTEDLSSYVDCELIVASREPVTDLAFPTVVADLTDVDSLKRALSGVRVAICAAGPYQDLPVSLAALCMERGVHYIDLADDRAFVRRVRSLAVRHENTCGAVCTGWSTVSALSGSLTRIAAAGRTALESIHIQMAPGNRGARQAATIASLLHSVGQPFTVFRNGAWQNVRGWSEPRDFSFPAPVGKRRGYLVDVPDHELFPSVFGVRTVEFRTGSELSFLNVFLSALSLLQLNWTTWTHSLQRWAALLSGIGTDSGAVGVEVRGAHGRRVCLVADSRAERIAVMPASIMTGLLLAAPYRNLIAYDNWLGEDQLRRECARRGLRLIVEEL